MSDWITALPNQPDATTLPRFRMFGITGTWMEADIIAATIRNAMTQGCERVYLVDNGSPDDTVDVARREGAILARSFATERHDEVLLRGHMNAVVSEVSQAEGVDHIWWLYFDADEFSHGPSGLTLHDYLATLDQRFRVVGMRFFDHFPGGSPQYVSGRHPLDFQPLCEEVSLPMCPSGHRKHPLQRFDRGGPPIECGRGLHHAHCAAPLLEPTQPAFLHHFPYRDERATRRRLEALWTAQQRGMVDGVLSNDCTHMLTRFRSLDAVYSQRWADVENFIALDPMYETMNPRPPVRGVHPKPWAESVEPEHQHVLRWYSLKGAWRYDEVSEFTYGDDVSLRKGIAYLDGIGAIEDWGCGFGHARQFVTTSEYVGVDGSSRHADKIVDLTTYTSDVDCIYMRHVLEHNAEWRRILSNALASFRKRMVLVIFTPLSDRTHQIGTSVSITSVPVPDISFRKDDLTDFFKHLSYSEEDLCTDTQYRTEHIFYIQK
jgi:glycosyltransferase involved in cell wall biosynthesis